MLSPTLAFEKRLWIDSLTTTSRCPGMNQRPSTNFTFGRNSRPSGIMPRTVTLTSPVPSLRGRTITTTHSPEAIGSPWLSLAMPGRFFNTGKAVASKPPDSSASEPLRSTSTFCGSPLVTKARCNPARSAIIKIAVVTVSAIPSAVMMVSPLRNFRFRML